MAAVTCASCGGENSPDALICLFCSANLTRIRSAATRSAATRSEAPVSEAPVSEAPVSEPRVSEAPRSESAAPDNANPDTGAGALACPFCGAEVPSPGNEQCVACLRDLPRGGRAVPLRPGGPTATRVERPGETVLTLALPTAERRIGSGVRLMLGRDPAWSAAADDLLPYDNVSRRHASVVLDAQGRAWARDEGSTNGTFVNGRRLDGAADVPLNDGDELRLGATVHILVRLGPLGR